MMESGDEQTGDELPPNAIHTGNNTSVRETKVLNVLDKKDQYATNPNRTFDKQGHKMFSAAGDSSPAPKHRHDVPVPS